MAENTEPIDLHFLEMRAVSTMVLRLDAKVSGQDGLMTALLQELRAIHTQI